MNSSPSLLPYQIGFIFASFNYPPIHLPLPSKEIYRINLNTHTSKMFKRIVTAAPRVGSVAPRAFAPLAGLQSVQAQPAVQRVAPAIATPIQRRGYHEKVLDHYNNPRNVGSFKKGDQDVGTGLVGAPACGDVMKLQIRVNKDSGKIDDVVFKTFGCGSAIASSSYLTELVRGMTLEEAGKIKNTDVAKELCLPPVKRTSSLPSFLQIPHTFRDT
jgi:Fe-S cluster assembly scaffold IscU